MQERYAKLGLSRPKPPDEFLERKAAEQQQPSLLDGTAHGLESLRAFEGMKQPHALGAITNPSAYSDPARKSAPATHATSATFALSARPLPAFAAASAFGNPTRKFAP